MVHNPPDSPEPNINALLLTQGPPLHRPFSGGQGVVKRNEKAKVLVVLSCLVPKASVITSE